MPLPYYYYILWFTVAIPALAGIVFFKRYPNELRVISIWMVVAFATELALVLTFTRSNNLYIVDIFSVVETILLTLYFTVIIVAKPLRAICYALCAFTIAAIICEVSISGLETWASFSTVVEAIAVCSMCFFVLYEITNDLMQPVAWRNPNFWIVGTIALYFTSSLQYFLLSRFLIGEEQKYIMLLWNIHTIVNAFCNLSYGLILCRSTSLLSSPR